MAGGDGSQAIVAAIAAELDLPVRLHPRGHPQPFALDLGVDRDDVVGALDAFVDGGERRVDLAEVNGRVFVNNVSLGLYAEAVQREGYREAKLRTMLDTVPEVLGPGGSGLDLRWTGPGRERAPPGAAILVSNNRYRLGARSARAPGRGSTTGCSGSRSPARPAAATAARAAAPVARVDGAPLRGRRRRAVPAGIDGEAVKLEPPLRFRIRPGVLRVRIARRHPAPRPPPRCPRASGRRTARSLGSPPDTTPLRTERTSVDIFEVEQKETLSREEVAARLRNLADMLARHNDIEFERGGVRFKVKVPDQVHLKLELEIESDERELEIELSWST